MKSSADLQILGFHCRHATFQIEPHPNREEHFMLILETETEPARQIGIYCSISDAFGAVTRQETGYAKWDNLEPHELPSRVHNITSWTFIKKHGTFSKTACS